VIVWDLADKSPRTQIRGSYLDIQALAFSPDGATLASSGRGWPRVWDVATGQLLLELDHHDYAIALAFSPDSNRIAVGNAESPFAGLAVRVWQLQNGRGLQSYRGLNSQISVVQFSPDSSRLAAMSHAWEVGVWETKTNRLLHVFLPKPGEYADNAAVAFSADNRHLAYTAGDQAHFWDLATDQEKRFALPRGFSDNLAFHAAVGKFISFRREQKAGIWTGVLRALTVDGFEPIGEIEDFNKGVRNGFLARDASVVLVDGRNRDQTGDNRKAAVYSVPDRKQLWAESYDAKFPGDKIRALDPEGKYCSLATGRNASTKFVTTETKLTEELGYDVHAIGTNAVLMAEMPPDSRTYRNLALRIHRRGNKNPLVTIATEVAGLTPRFNRASTHLVWGTTDGAVILCDIGATQANLAAMGLGW